jgi:metallo-beta-lactamase family protein
MATALMELSFLGATGTVTGSRYLVRQGDSQLLIDCGLFQGYKQLRLKNWAPPTFDPRSINAVLLTHAHLDHSGYLPLLVKLGFRGKIFCTRATYETCRILLPDSGFLQEEQARFDNRHSYSKHKPALPLYTEEDAEHCLERFEVVRSMEEFVPASGLRATLSPAGHLLGASSIRIAGERVAITFSGDIGRPQDPLMKPPAALRATDYLVVESTYGDRKHPSLDIETELAVPLAAACARSATVVIPAFAVGRAQLLLLLISRLKKKGLLPDVPVYLDSPMAINATELYQRFPNEHRLSPEECAAMSQAAQLVRTADDSKALASQRGPQIIISASGMATGGRVVHHLKRWAPDSNSLILLTGFQAGGTRGAALAAGAKTLRIHGEDVPVNAQVVQIDSLSAHADADELLDWLRTIPQPPQRVFITHGEPAASDALRGRIERELHWPVTVPEYRDTVQL